MTDADRDHERHERRVLNACNVLVIRRHFMLPAGGQAFEMVGKFLEATISLARRWRENPGYLEQADKKLRAAQRIMQEAP